MHVPGLRADKLLDFEEDFRIFGKKQLGVLATLAEEKVVVAEVRAALVDNVLFDGQVQHVARLGNAVIVHDVELGDSEGRGDLVLGDLDRACGCR